MRFFNFIVLTVLMFGCTHTDLGSGDFEKLERETGGRIGVSVLDIRTGKRILYRSGERFPFCSTFKTIAVATALKHGDLSTRLTFTSDDVKKAGYAPITTKFVDRGMTVSELSEAAIQYSDNAAVNILMRNLGGLQAVNTFAREIGDEVFQLDRWEPELNSAEPLDKRDTTTPDAMTGSVHKILLGDALAAFARDLLLSWHIGNTTGDKRIRAGLPKGWTAAEKTGTCSHGTTNDAGVIWRPDGSPIVLTIYLTGRAKDAKPDDAAVARATQIIVEKLGAL
ncbi:MAG: class A beta-lactamase [Bdellovibrionota bacterium]|nr:MAG: class A beta-lactamase [Pseudomonadota bacterium]